MYEVTLLPIVFAAIAQMVIGMVWYHPKVFGAAWMRMANITPEMVESGKKTMAVRFIVAFLAAMLAAYVLFHFGIAWGVYDWAGAIELGVWIWLGFVAPVMLHTVLWEQKPLSLFALNAAYWFVGLVVMSVILVL